MAILTVGPALVKFEMSCTLKATDVEDGGNLRRGTALSAYLTLQVTLSGEIL